MISANYPFGKEFKRVSTQKTRYLLIYTGGENNTHIFHNVLYIFSKTTILHLNFKHLYSNGQK